MKTEVRTRTMYAVADGKGGTHRFQIDALGNVQPWDGSIEAFNPHLLLLPGDVARIQLECIDQIAESAGFVKWAPQRYGKETVEAVLCSAATRFVRLEIALEAERGGWRWWLSMCGRFDIDIAQGKERNVAAALCAALRRAEQLGPDDYRRVV